MVLTLPPLQGFIINITGKIDYNEVTVLGFPFLNDPPGCSSFPQVLQEFIDIFSGNLYLFFSTGRPLY